MDAREPGNSITYASSRRSSPTPLGWRATSTVGHCLVAAVLVVDDENLFEDNPPLEARPEVVRLLVASPRERERRGIRATSASA
jgi:hypothetical protein